MEDNWIDTVINEQYQFVRLLKRTDKTEICVFRHKELGKQIVKRTLKGSGEVYFALRTLSHPNIANVYDVVKTETGVTVLEEYVDGQTVADYLQTGLYSPSGVGKVISSLCDALDLLHSHQIIHKDIKPENVMIDSGGNVKLIDFDAARLYKPYQSKDTQAIGTMGYAAPEQYGINHSSAGAELDLVGEQEILRGVAHAAVAVQGEGALGGRAQERAPRYGRWRRPLHQPSVPHPARP